MYKSCRCHGPSGPMQWDINTRRQTNTEMPRLKHGSNPSLDSRLCIHCRMGLTLWCVDWGPVDTRDENSVFVCLSSFIFIPLHGARRAMAAAVFYTFLTHFLTSTSLRGHSEVLLILYPASPENRCDHKGKTKEKYRLP